MQKLLPLEIWLPFSTGPGLGEWGEWLLAFLSCSCREGEVGAEPHSSLPGRLILELNPGTNIARGKHCTCQYVSRMADNTHEIPLRMLSSVPVG